MRNSLLVVLALSVGLAAASYPSPKEADWVIRTFVSALEKSFPSCASTTRPSATRLASRC
jgi:hypothetical protein